MSSSRKKILITARTAAVAAHSIDTEFGIGSHMTAGMGGALSCYGLATTEEVDIFVWHDGDWVGFLTEAGAAIVLTATIKRITITAPGRYSVLKDISAGAAQVEWDY